MSAHKPYPAYRDSGVPWLGKVPEHWLVKALKWISPVKRGASPRPIEDPKYFDDDGEYAWVRITDVSLSDGVLIETTQRLSSLGSSLSVQLEPGQLFISIAGTVGKPCLTAIKACIHDGFVYFPRLTISPKFLFHIFEAGTCYAGLGKMGTQLNLNTDTIGGIRITVPPPKELNQILAFLDRETAKIDALIATQRRLIDLLKEKRSALISHAVTKGLNPDAPMKESGVPWLGEVPEGWGVAPLKWFGDIKGGTGFPHVDQGHADEDLPFHKVNALSRAGDDGFIWSSENTISIETAEKLRAFIFPEDTLVFAKVGAALLLGRIRVLGCKACIDNNMMGFLIDVEKADMAFMRHAMSLIHFDFLANPGAVPSLNEGQIGCFELPYPGLSEQTAIAAYLDRETAKIDALIAKTEKAIELAQERRSALISAAVTGKIDVRDVWTHARA